jgi:hypothetical protein
MAREQGTLSGSKAPARSFERLDEQSSGIQRDTENTENYCQPNQGESIVSIVHQSTNE